MLLANNFNRAIKAQDETRQTVRINAFHADFMLTGVDNDYIYFQVVAALDDISPKEIKDLKEKTGFETIEETQLGCYVGFFKKAL